MTDLKPGRELDALAISVAAAVKNAVDSLPYPVNVIAGGAIANWGAIQLCVKDASLSVDQKRFLLSDRFPFLTGEQIESLLTGNGI